MDCVLVDLVPEKEVCGTTVAEVPKREVRSIVNV